MMPVHCPRCSAKLKVKEELTGKKVRCPNCRQLILVPNVTVAFQPQQAPFADDDTVPPQAPSGPLPPEPSTVPVSVSREEEVESVEAKTAYWISNEIARGGMGAIMRAVDGDIQREVAVKFLLNQADARQKARFVEEAQITGQLEHPNIVPIHQLGVHEDGRCFFSMKMVKGRSLAEILKDQASGYTLGRLLGVFVSICNAMAYAHSRNVVHRDLKPANIMVGDFGEVYVMDWGLAKVLDREPREPSGSDQLQQPELSLSANGSDSQQKITTQRQGDLTQAGAIMGTPAYMPPEQAKGDDVDHRADIYSLGAILYEMMTLTPPPGRGNAGRGDDMLAILMRVVEGQIDDPVQRSPARAQTGWIPAELSAIAMKALAHRRDNRYQSTEAMRRDIDLFLEGRSVSAKRDSAWEMATKFVKRNKGLSAGVALALLVLLTSLGVVFSAWRETRAEQAEKERRTKEAVPALIQAARLSIEKLDVAQAEKQVDLALLYAAQDADARLLKAMLLIVGKKYPQAVQELDAYLLTRPKDRDAANLRELCVKSDPREPTNLLEISAAFSSQGVRGLAELTLKEFGTDLPAARKQLLEMYRSQIEKGWPGQGPSLTLDNTGLFRIVVKSNIQIATLEPLRKIPISSISFLASTGRDTRFAANDLSPLQGMPLTSLTIVSGTQVRDLEPLRGMSLETLHIGNADFLDDLSPLAGMKTLQVLILKSCPRVADLSPLNGLSLTTLEISGSHLGIDLSPLKGMPLISMRMNAAVLTKNSSMEVLRSIPTLKSLYVQGAGGGAFSRDELFKLYDAGEFRRKK